jgi:hypothetical protein
MTQANGLSSEAAAVTKSGLQSVATVLEASVQRTAK